MLAQNAIFHCGKHFYASVHITESLSRITIEELEYRANIASIERLMGVDKLLQRRYCKDFPNSPFYQRANLLELVNDFEGSQCSDPRDKIFELLGIADDENAKLNPPGYQMSVEQVNERLIRTWIVSKDNLDVLNCC